MDHESFFSRKTGAAGGGPRKGESPSEGEQSLTTKKNINGVFKGQVWKVLEIRPAFPADLKVR